MSDITYLLTLSKEQQAFFKSLSNTDINRCCGKTAIMALNMAQRRPANAFTKTGGKFYNKQMIADEITRLLTINPINLTKPVCNFHNEAFLFSF